VTGSCEQGNELSGFREARGNSLSAEELLKL